MSETKNFEKELEKINKDKKIIKTDENFKDIVVLENQFCPVCGKNDATYTEYEIEDPYAGSVYIFTLKCKSCGYKTSDLELENSHDPAEYSIDIENKDDLNIRVIKSGESEFIIPKIGLKVQFSLNSDSFISNIEGVLNRFLEQLRFMKSEEEDKKIRTRLKNLIKKLEKVKDGSEKMTLKLKDLSGNSVIISDKVKIKKIKK